MVRRKAVPGGLIAASVTDIPGASAVFFGGIVSYDNNVKEQLLGVKQQTLEAYGAVSEQTAREMARGAVSALGTALAVSVTGIAGPGRRISRKACGTRLYRGVLEKRRYRVSEKSI